MTDECWLPVPGYEGAYEVSDMGRVRSLDRTVTQKCRWGGTMQKFYRGRVLRVRTDERGRKFVNLWWLCEGVSRNIAALVATAFLGARPPGSEVCHGDGNPGNNVLRNLRYDTHVNNEADKKLHGTYLFGETAPTAKLTEDQVRVILASPMRGVDLADVYGVTPAAISAIRTGKNWRHV